LIGAPGDLVKIGAPLVVFEAAAAEDSGTVVGVIPEAEETPKTPAPDADRPSGRVKAAPAVRALARRLGVDLAVVSPSGPKETITSTDVERAAAVLEAAGPLEPLRGVRRAMARNMERAHAEVVPATVTDVADIDAWPAGVGPSRRSTPGTWAGTKGAGSTRTCTWVWPWTPRTASSCRSCATSPTAKPPTCAAAWRP
jgi:pyruvate dehydrogenase E2 component (dihydrolipoamide acetyltransferase)